MRHFLCFLAVIVWAVAMRAQGSDEVLGPRFFTDVDGRTMSAVILGIGERDVRVRRTDGGMEFSVPLERLSVLDRRYLEENRERILARLATEPETDFTRALRKDFVIADPRTGAAGPVPAQAWAKAKWFVAVTGVPEDLTVSRLIAKTWADWAATDETVALLWVGPAVHGADPTPEFERRLVRELPPTVALLGGAARRDALAKERDELRKLAEAQAPRRTDLFFAAWRERTPAERELWLRRTLALQPAYWPTWVDASRVVSTEGGPRVFVADREGKPAPAEVLARFRAPARLSPFPDRTAVSAPAVGGAASWAEFPGKPTHVFRMPSGAWPAQVLGMGPETVVVRAQGVNSDRLLGLASLSAEDRAALEKLRGEAGQVVVAADAMPAREATGAEIAKAGRFATNVLLRRDGSNAQALRWEGRPAIKVHAAEPEAEAAVRRIYEEFCAAAGLAGAPTEGLEIVLCVGPRDYIDRKRRELTPDLEPVSGSRWRFWWNERRALTKVVSYQVAHWGQPDIERLLFSRVSEAFGLVGDSKEFPGSAFHTDARHSRLSDEDRRLLRVVYRHLPYAAGRDAIVRTIGERWANPDGGAGAP